MSIKLYSTDLDKSVQYTDQDMTLTMISTNQGKRVLCQGPESDCKYYLICWCPQTPSWSL